jgi:hypothetical protein
MDTQTVSKKDIRRNVITAVVYWLAEQQVNDFYERHELESHCMTLYQKVVGREWGEFEMDLLGLILELFEQLGFGKWVSEKAYQEIVLDTLPEHYLEEHGVPFELAKEDEDADKYAFFHLKEQVTLSIDQILWHLRLRSYLISLKDQMRWHNDVLAALELLEGEIVNCKAENGTKKEFLELKVKVIRDCPASRIKTHLVSVITTMEESY